MGVFSLPDGFPALQYYNASAPSYNVLSLDIPADKIYLSCTLITESLPIGLDLPMDYGREFPHVARITSVA